MDEINKNKINNNAGAGPQINISVETIESVYHSYSQWRTAKTYLPLTAAEKAEYYKGYDPIIGVKIAGTLSVLFALAVLYVFYKSKCKRTKYPSTQICLDDPLFMEHQMLSSSCSLHQHQQQAGSTAAVFASWDANSGILPASGTVASDDAFSPGGLLGIKRQNSCESGQETPVSVISSGQQHHHHHHQPHYYTDDREMPEWKKYAKELFLYGGPGLWRSASLKGSDPVLLMAQNSFDSESLIARSQLRSGSLSGSMMANLGIHHRRDSSRKHSVAMSTNSPTQSRLQVPNMGSGCSRPNRRRYTEFHPDDKFIILPPSGRNSSNRNQQTSATNHRHNNKDDGSDKPLPSRSVSFRESDMTNYQHGRTGSRRSRTRPGSLKTPRTDYNRLISDHNIDNNGQCGNSHRRSSFRLPSRQNSIRTSRNLVTNNDATDQLMDPDCPIPSSDPNSRTVIVHRIPLHMQVDRHGNKGLYSRSTSLTTEPARGWRSTIAKLMRAKSTSGNAVGGNNGSDSGGVGSPSRCSKAISKLASLEGHHHIKKPSVDSSGGPNSPASVIGDDHFDICVIQATPTASPCASIRSTLSGDSLEMSCLGVNKNPSFPSINLPKMSVRERRKCFANMKGQTIVDQDAALLAPPVMDYGLLMLPGAEHSASPRCRSASPSMMNSYGNRSPSPGEASSWLQVLQHQQQKESAENHNNLSSNSSLSNHSSSHI